MDRWSSSGEKSQRREKSDKRESGEKLRNTAFSPMFCGSGGSKSRLAKAAGAEAFDRMTNQQLHAAVAWSIFRSPNAKNTSALEPLEVEISKKCTHALVAHTWKILEVKRLERLSLRSLLEVEMLKKCMRQSCEAMSKSTVLNTDGLGPLLDVEMSKKCTALWHAHLEVKLVKAHNVRTTFGHSVAFSCKDEFRMAGVVQDKRHIHQTC